MATARIAMAFAAAASFLGLAACNDAIAPFEQQICLLAPESRLDLPCSDEPLRIAEDPGFVALAGGQYHTCGLTASGEAHCWGWTLGEWHEIRTTPSRVPGDHRFATLTAGAAHTCALTADGTAYCWGANHSGELGTGTDAAGRTVASGTPARVATDISFIAITAGTSHTCGVAVDGTVHCWGMDWYGEIGRGRWEMERVPTPSAVVGGHLFGATEAGQRATCALDREGRAFCWGFGQIGQLGTLATSVCHDIFISARCSPWPIPVATARRFVSLTSGGTHLCALTANGEAFCWGDVGQGQLGPGDGHGYTPIAIPELRFASVEAGGATTCGITTAGETLCWGLNHFGQLGTRRRVYSTPRPEPVAGGHRFTYLAGGFSHFCGIAGSGATYCWGSNERAQLGTGTW
jgi:alpha-tubulin suppressor-like RCC1 family protein